MVIADIPHCNAPSTVTPVENPDRELVVTLEAVSVVGSKFAPSALVIIKSFGKTTLLVPPLTGMLIVIEVAAVREETEVMLSEDGLVKSPAARSEPALSGETLEAVIDGTTQFEVSKLQLISQAKLPLEYPKLAQVLPCKFPLSQSSPLSTTPLPQTLILTVAFTLLVELACVYLASNENSITNAKENSVR